MQRFTKKVKLTGDMKATLALSNTAVRARPVEKEKSVLSPPGDPWIRVTSDQAPQGHIGADV